MSHIQAVRLGRYQRGVYNTAIVLCGTGPIVLEGFLGVAGERVQVQDPYSITVMFCHCHI